ncbi:MAG: carbohydrate ABC transporter permease [Candidatus Methylacidiphilales bacterium]|nr:sugar ABC transporter permease [Candidatus Methylacidiphilales bacterium]
MAQPISNRKALHEWQLYLFVVPSLILVLIFAYYPALSAIYHSFYDWTGGDFKQFIGMENFRNALNDKVFWNSFITLGILVAANIIKMIPSIFMAVLIHRLTSDRWQYWYRVLLVVPMIVPGLVTLFIWKFFFDPSLGLLNATLDASGVKSILVSLDANVLGWNVFREGIPIAWLSEPILIIPSLIIWGFPWIGAVGVLIYLAGLQSIGTEVYEAADLDGASSWQKFIYIEFPLIMTQVRLSLILMIIGSLKDFGLQLLLLGDSGGPGGRGMVPGLWMYNRAFTAGQFGYACALGLILFCFILALTFINNKYVRVEK